MRKATAITAWTALAVGLNLMAWMQNPFSIWVLGLVALSVLGGAAWLAMALRASAGRAMLEGRAIGGINAALSSALFLGICIVLYALVAAWDVSWDLTREGRRQLAPQTVQVLQGMTREAKVTCFFINVQDELVLIARDKTMRFLEQCQQHTDLLKVELLDPHIDRLRLEAMNVTHTSPQGTVVIGAGARQRIITLSGGSPRLEERDFTNALINVLRDAEPKVCFLTGHNERDLLDEGAGGASMLKNLLEGESYKTERIGIKITDPEVPQDCTVLVINNPSGDLHPQELFAVEAYLRRGGRLFLLMDPWRSVRQSPGGEALRPWLEERYGIRVGSDIVLTDRHEQMWQEELSTDNAPFQHTDEGFMEFRGAYSAEHPVTRGFAQSMVMQATRTVRRADTVPDGVFVTPLLRSKPYYWAERDVARFAETGQAQRNEDDETGPLYLAVAAVAPSDAEPGGGRPRETRIIVVGDSDITSNNGLAVPGNFNFVLNAFAWLTEHEELIAIRPSGKETPPLLLSPMQKRAVTWISILFTAQAVAAAGLGVRWLRRKHQ